MEVTQTRRRIISGTPENESYCSPLCHAEMLLLQGWKSCENVEPKEEEYRGERLFTRHSPSNRIPIERVIYNKRDALVRQVF